MNVVLKKTSGGTRTSTPRGSRRRKTPGILSALILYTMLGIAWGSQSVDTASLNKKGTLNMSFKAMTWASSIKTGSPTKKLVLLLLADRANDSGECWPSLQKIADDCELSKRSVQDNIKRLENAGLLEIVQRKSGDSQLSNIYRLHVGGVQEVPYPIAGGAIPPIAGGATKPVSIESVNESIDEMFKSDFKPYGEGWSGGKIKALGLWLEYKKERRQAYKARGLNQLLKKYASMPDDDFIKMVEFSISQNYSGLFAPKCTPNSGRKKLSGSKNKEDYQL